MDKQLSYDELMALYLAEKKQKEEFENKSKRLENKVVKLENKATKLENKATKLENKATKLENKATKLENKATKLEGKSKELENKVVKLENKTTKLENKATKLENKATKLENKATKLENKAIKLEDKVEKLQAKSKEQQIIINTLLKKLEDKDIKLKKQLCDRFGIKSDKKSVVIANEAEVHATVKLKDNKKKSGRKTGTFDASKFDKSLIDVKEVVIDQENKTCDVCGAELTSNGEKIQYKVDITPAKVTLTKYIIKQYKCEKCSSIVEEPEINTFNNESFLTPSLASFIVNNKYNYALPLYRQESMLKQLGAPLTRQQLSNYCINVADKLQPIYEELKKKLLATQIKVLHADETTLKVINNKDTRREKCYMWVYSTGIYEQKIFIYEYQLSRKATHPQKFLKDYKGYLVCDDYSGYENIENVILCRCWFHAKKKYADFIKTLNQKQLASSIAVVIHNKISNIFHEDDKIFYSKLTPREIKKKRLEVVKPLVDEYFNYIENLQNNGIDRSSELGRAINYSISNKEGLLRFFEDGHIPMTNNVAERDGIKPFVILRKNCLFCNTEGGAEATAILMSIVQTAKQNLIKPDEYIKYLLEVIDDTPISKVVDLLPTSNKLPSILYYKKADLDS